MCCWRTLRETLRETPELYLKPVCLSVLGYKGLEPEALRDRGLRLRGGQHADLADRCKQVATAEELHEEVDINVILHCSHGLDYTRMV